MHSSSNSQTLKQEPQLTRLVSRSTQMPPQQLSLAQHLSPQSGALGRQVMQTPAAQASDPPQAIPQPPQLARSDCVSRQTELQHVSPGAQATPHAPQLALSLSSCSHFPSPSQSSRPFLQRHLPFCPPLHVAPSQQSLFLSHLFPTYLQPAAASSTARLANSPPTAPPASALKVLRRETASDLVMVSNRVPSIGAPFRHRRGPPYPGRNRGMSCQGLSMQGKAADASPCEKSPLRVRHARGTLP